MKQLIFIFVLFFSFVKIDATEQHSDILYINDEKYYILNKILNRNIIGKYIDKKGLNDEINSSLWHGYIAEYEIKNGLFHVKDISVPVNFMKENFIKIKEYDPKIFKTFKNTVLIVSKKDTNMFYLNENLSAIKIIEIKNNKIVKNLEMNAYENFVQFRNDQFQKYKLTDFYKKDYHSSLFTIENSRKKYHYGDDIPIEKEVEDLIIANMFNDENFTHIL